MFATNTEAFILKAIKIVNNQKNELVAKCIKYGPSGEEPHDRSIFEAARSRRDYERAMQAKKAVQDYLFWDSPSEAEMRFAKDAEAAGEVAVYTKLPKGGYRIPTPLGNHSPDWAVAFEQGKTRRPFCVAETKGTDPAINELGLRGEERLKIDCARKLFGSLPGEGVEYYPVESYRDLLDAIGGPQG
jgi:type III restriction enzyme